MNITGYLVLILIWLVFEAALALVLAASDGQHRRNAAGQMVLAIVRVLLVALTAMQLERVS